MNKSEKKCIEMFRKVLGTQNVVSNKGCFDFLRGDKGTKLRVDAFFPDFSLVVEYMGRQHYSPVHHFNRRPNREEQRKKYDALRAEKLKEHNIKLILFRFEEELTEENVKKKLKEAGIIL